MRKNVPGARRILFFVLCFLAFLKPVQVTAAVTTILGGDYTVSLDGEYQLADGCAGTITIENNVNTAKIIGSTATHAGTSVVIAGGRSGSLSLTIENLKLGAIAGSAAIDFGAAGDYPHQLRLSGMSRLDGNAAPAVRVPAGVQLTIGLAAGLENDADGQLTAYAGRFSAGIGGAPGEDAGTITLTGGTITTGGGGGIPGGTSGGGAGVGGGTSGAGGVITVSGGIITAQGGDYSAGIGGGKAGGFGTIVINGGTVTSRGGWWGPGIGGGSGATTAGSISISNGSVTAKGGFNGAGIGTGCDGVPGNISISGGTVIATGEAYGSGIGGGCESGGCTIIISGGDVTANAGNYNGTGGSAGLGGGNGGNAAFAGSTGSITISGGTLKASGFNGGAGIGSGPWGKGGSVVISGNPAVIARGSSDESGFWGDNIGNGKMWKGPTTLANTIGEDISYLFFDANGMSALDITVGSDAYQTNAQGLLGVFVPRSGSIAYTASRDGYVPVNGSLAVTSMNHTISLVMDLETTVESVTAPANGTYKAGDTLDFTVVFSETVSGADSSLALNVGGENKAAAYYSGAGDTVVYRYTVQAGDNDTNGITIGSIAGTLEDINNNAVNTSLAGVVPGTAGILIDTAAPGVSGQISVPADGTYKIGDNLDFTVYFTENVAITGSGSTLGLTVGGVNRTAAYQSKTASSVTYRYGVQSGDLSEDGITVGSINLNGTTIRDAAGNDADLTLTSHVPDTTGIGIDGIRPAVTSVAVAPDSGLLAAGASLDFTVSFAENVNITGTGSTLGLTIGGTGRAAAYHSKTAGAVTYRYTVQNGDNTGGGFSIGTITLNGTTIRDGAGNDADLSLAGHIPSTAGIIIDTTPPASPVITGMAEDTGVSATDAITSDTTLVISGTAEADGTVRLYRGGIPIGTNGASVTGNWSYDYSGTPLVDGTYVFTADCTDAAGNTGEQSADFAVTVDTTPPAAPAVTAISSDTGVSATDAITNDTTLVISGTAEAGGTVEVYCDANPIGTAAVSGAGAWSYDYSGTPLDEGIYIFTADCTDAAGNTGEQSAGFAVTVDTTPPAAPTVSAISNDTGLFGNDRITNDTTLVVSGTAEAGGTVKVYRGGSPIGTAVVSGAGAWTFDYSGTSLDDGTYVFTADCTDTAGNTGEQSAGFTVTVDTTAPAAPAVTAISSDTGVSATDAITGDTTLVVSGTAEADGEVKVYCDDELIGTASVSGIGNWSYDYSGTSLNDGIYVFTADCTDAAGNTGEQSAEFTVTVDTTPPAAPTVSAISSDTGVSAIDAITNDATLVVSGTAEAGGVVAVLLSGDEIGSCNVNGMGAWSYDYTAVILTDGAYVFTATCTDRAGNTSCEAEALPVTIDIDSPAEPIITGISDDAGTSGSDGITNDNTISISGTAEAGGTVEIHRGGSPIGTAVVSGVGAWTFDYSGTSLDDGTYVFTADCTDAAGNTGAKSTDFTVTVDTAAPEAPSVPDLSAESDSGASDEDNLTSDTTPTLTGTAEAASIVTVYDEEAMLGTATAAAEGDWSFTAPALTDGAHAVYATATDPAGNTGAVSAPLSFTVDTAPPVIAIQGSSTISIRRGREYIDAGATALDMVDGDVSAGLNTLNPVDTGIKGTYTVTYSVTDRAGNTAQAIRTVAVTVPKKEQTGPLPESILTVFDVSAVTPDDMILSQSLRDGGGADIDLVADPDATAVISAGVIEALAKNDLKLTLESTAVQIEFPSTVLSGLNQGDATDTGAQSFEITVRELSPAEAEEVMAAALSGGNSGFFTVGGTMVDLSIQMLRSSAAGTDKAPVAGFAEPVRITIDLSALGELSPGQIAALTGVRYETDAAGAIKVVKLGGRYDPLTRTFSFYTERFSRYGVLGAERIANIILTLEKTEATVNGASRLLDAAPLLRQGRTLVPLRFVGEAFGAYVEWQVSTGTVLIVLDGMKLELKLDRTVPGLDVPPLVLGGRAMVPIRYISEALGGYVQWLPANREIEIVR